MSAPVYTVAHLRDGREVKAFVEQGTEPPLSRLALVQMLTGAASALRGVREATGSAYRRDLVSRIDRALAAERGGQVVKTLLIAVGVTLALAGCAHAGTRVAGVDNGTCTAIEASWIPMDAEGRLQAELRLPGQPWRDVGAPRSEVFCMTLPAHVRITKVRTFFATDRSDKAEAALHVVVNGYQVVTRSEHKETDGIYDAWKSELVQYVTGDSTAPLMVHASAWSTVADRTVNVQFGVIVEMTWSGQ